MQVLSHLRKTHFGDRQPEPSSSFSKHNVVEISFTDVTNLLQLILRNNEVIAP